MHCKSALMFSLPKNFTFHTFTKVCILRMNFLKRNNYFVLFSNQRDLYYPVLKTTFTKI